MVPAKVVSICTETECEPPCPSQAKLCQVQLQTNSLEGAGEGAILCLRYWKRAGPKWLKVPFIMKENNTFSSRLPTVKVPSCLPTLPLLLCPPQPMSCPSSCPAQPCDGVCARPPWRGRHVAFIMYLSHLQNTTLRTQRPVTLRTLKHFIPHGSHSPATLEAPSANLP